MPHKLHGSPLHSVTITSEKNNNNKHQLTSSSESRALVLYSFKLQETPRQAGVSGPDHPGWLFRVWHSLHSFSMYLYITLLYFSRRVYQVGWHSSLLESQKLINKNNKKKSYKDLTFERTWQVLQHCTSTEVKGP